MSNRYSCDPDAAALAEFRTAWSWCLPPAFEVLLVSAFGDVFFETEGDGIHWLNTGTAEIERVAADRDEFQAKLQSEEGFEWLKPDLVDALEEAGKPRQADQCYTYAVLPIFAGGEYEPSNFKAVPAIEHFGVTAHIHRQIVGLPDGTEIEIKVGP